MANRLPARAAAAIKALNTITKNKFNEYFIKNNKLNAQYRILINGRDFDCEDKVIGIENADAINNSELIMKKKDLKTIDIVPLIESNGSGLAGIFQSILGAILIVFGAVFGNPALIFAGIALLAAGIVSLLSKPPTFNYTNNAPNSASQSYLFAGPTNTVGEGNPIPIGYGTLLVGSNVVSAGYKIIPYQTPNQAVA